MATTHLTAIQLAVALGVSDRWIYELQARGVIARDATGVCEIKQVLDYFVTQYEKDIKERLEHVQKMCERVSI